MVLVSFGFTHPMVLWLFVWLVYLCNGASADAKSTLGVSIHVAPVFDSPKSSVQERPRCCSPGNWLRVPGIAGAVIPCDAL